MSEFVICNMHAPEGSVTNDSKEETVFNLEEADVFRWSLRVHGSTSFFFKEYDCTKVVFEQEDSILFG
jgi:hypothetical protein